MLGYGRLAQLPLGSGLRATIPEVERESGVERTKRAGDGFGDLIYGFELKVSVDRQTFIMNGENLAEYGVVLAHETLLDHHSNSGWGTFDDNIIGALFFIQTLWLHWTCSAPSVT